MSELTESIRFAQKDDIPALCAIWRSCFSDSEEYIRLFYRNNFERIRVLIYECDAMVVSAVHLIDAVFTDGSTEQPAKYIYAAGTHPDFRKKGFMSALLRHIIKQAQQSAYALFLKPSSAEVTAFYQKFGFEPDAAWTLQTFEPGKSEAIEISALSAQDYNRLRNKAFGAHAYVKWQDAHVDWCITENAYFGGKTLAVKCGGETYFLMGAPEKDTFVITETNLSESRLTACCDEICKLFETTCIKAYLPALSCTQKGSILSSIVFNARMRNVYVNLILI